MIKVHHLAQSRSERILWLLEELELPYEIRSYGRDARTNLAPAELKAVHPLGKSPVIEDDGQAIAESGAIVEYLTHKAGALRVDPASPAYRDYVFFMHFAEGSLMAAVVLKLVMTRIEGTKMPFFAKPIAKKIAGRVMASYVGPTLQSQLDFVEQHLTGGDVFAGEGLSGADIMMAFPLRSAARLGSELGPATRAYLDRIAERPAFVRAVERGDT